MRRLTRKAKRSKEKNIASQAKTNQKAFWSYAQSKMKTKPGIPDLEYNGKVATTDLQKAEVLADFYSSVFTQEPNTQLPEFPMKEIGEIFPSQPITKDEVTKKLKNLKVNKSPGPDSMHPRVLQETAEELSVPLTIIFNHSLRLGRVPTKWKEALITAIFKKGSKSLPGNYRPVSLTAMVCKVMESILRDRIVQHMVRNSLFSSKQFGFINGRSTVLQLLYVLDIWTEILDDEGSIDAIYCDYMKAFDKVPHKRLLHKLKSYGIENSILSWIESFLWNRTQQVAVNGTRSDAREVTSGIPQGSVLGPILFVIYINDLPEIVDEKTHIFLFADDTKVFREIRNTEDCKLLQEDLSKMFQWTQDWLLKFHPEKCVSMRVGKADPPLHTYSLDSHNLEYSTCEKDIGVHIDNKLKFDTHINLKINKANRTMGIIRRTFDYMDKEIFCQLFKALVRPHVEYANQVWAPHLKKHRDAIENVQRRATKLIPGLFDLSYKERLQQLNLPSLAYRRIRGDMIEVFKLVHPELGYDATLEPLLPINTRTSRGNRFKLFHRRARIDIRKYSFGLRVTKMWNDLPDNVVCAPSVKSFEKRLDVYWKDQEIKFDYTADFVYSRNRNFEIDDEDETDLNDDT